MSQKQQIQSQSEEERLENIMKEHSLPKAWKWMKLDQVCITTKNRDPKITPDLPFRYVDISSVNNRLKRITDTHTILGKDAPSRARQIIKANDVIVSMTRPNLNAVALVPEDLNDEICSTGFCVLRPKEFIDALFLFEFVQSKYFIETVSGKVRGMLYPAITDNQVREVNIPIPPLPEQKKIAIKTQELIQIVENARIACEKQLEVAKALSSAYLREVFESEEAKKWERRKLGKVCSVIMGQSPPGYTYTKEPSGLPFFQGKADFGEYFPTVKVWCTQPIKIAKEGDILLSIRAPVGPVNLSNMECCFGRGLAAIRCKVGIINLFIFWYLTFVKNRIASLGSGSTFNAITRNDLINLQIPQPSLIEQKRIAIELKEKMEQIENLNKTIEDQLKNINTLPQAVLRKAFEGKL